MHRLQPIALDEHAFAPYGHMLGKPFPPRPGVPQFTNPATDFWQEHLFDTGVDGEPEILWVNYRSKDPVIANLEKHLLTQQAIVPLTGEILHVVARSHADGSPDLFTLAAFVIARGQGVCMLPDCWHATRVRHEEVQCLMLTRRSTTADLIRHLTTGKAAAESAIVPVEGVRVSCP